MARTHDQKLFFIQCISCYSKHINYSFLQNMDHETKYVLMPLCIIIFPEIVSHILGISDIAIGGYYINKGIASDPDCKNLEPISGMLIAVGISKIISCLIFMDQQQHKYKFGAFVIANICVFGGSIPLCILAFKQLHLGCTDEMIINYTIGVSIFRLLVYIMFGIILLVVSIESLFENKTILGKPSMTLDDNYKEGTEPQISIV